MWGRLQGDEIVVNGQCSAWVSNGGWRMAPWFDVQTVAAGVFGIAAGFVTIVVVSLLTRAPPKESERFVANIRHTPRREDA